MTTKPTHKSAREIFHLFDDYCHYDEKKIDQTLAQLAELVREDKVKIVKPENMPFAFYEKLLGFNEALEHIAQKLEGKE